MTAEEKAKLKRKLAEDLQQAPEVRKVIVFGSFQSSDAPRDMDVAVFVDQSEGYLPLALKLRRLAHDVSELIPLDIIPIRPDATGAIMEEIHRGELIYER